MSRPPVLAHHTVPSSQSGARTLNQQETELLYHKENKNMVGRSSPFLPYPHLHTLQPPPSLSVAPPQLVTHLFPKLMALQSHRQYYLHLQPFSHPERFSSSRAEGRVFFSVGISSTQPKPWGKVGLPKCLKKKS